MAVVGLSPLARGGRQARAAHLRALRVIPACAGYPRLRGVDRLCQASRPRRPGLSPLARGGLYRRFSACWNERVIPACAGWTHRQACRPVGGAGYPRLRGVDNGCLILTGSQSGLSPLARGGRPTLLCRLLSLRVIPACAGWTFAVSAECPADAGYPRLRGVDRGFEVFGNRIHGLSPLARGGRSYGLSAAFSRRVIPACAGWTSTGTGCASKAAGYPRLRGVDLADEARDDAVAGLSPLARGGHTER